MYDFCRTLLATEVRGARRYYHMPARGDVYPPQFAARKMVGVLGALSTGADTWFGPGAAFAHGIQLLPITPVTEDLLDPAFVAEDVAYLETHLEPDVDDAWRAFLDAEAAVVDADRAWAALSAVKAVDAGASRTALLYWAATRPAAPEA